MYDPRIVLIVLLASITVFSQSKLSAETQKYVSHNQGTYLLQNLTMIDGTGTSAKPDQDILIQGANIVAVGKNLKIPDSIKVIDMAGKSVIPGLVMLHEHLFYPKSTPETIYGIDQMSYSFPKLYLAAGVTAMRTAGSIMPQADVNIKKAINNGQTPGPKMDVTTPHLDREGLNIYELGSFDTSEEAVNAINFYADMGVTSVKVYNYITKEDLRAIVKAAHNRNMKVTGHLCSITYREAADIGINNLEHGFFASSDFIQNKEADTCQPFDMYQSMLTTPVDSKLVSDLISHLVNKEVALTSTINVFEPYTNREVVPGGGIDALFTNAKEKVYKRWSSKQGKDSIDYIRFNKAKIWEKQFFDAGGLLVAGTDPTYDGRIVAGYANMRLLELFVEMGFTVPQAIQIASLNGAKYLEQEASIGSIAPLKVADLVIINGDISKDISQIRNIETVFKNGIGYDSQKLFKAAEGLVGIR